jgi:glycosyltransferase involved in cell wall biosynthesis
MHLLLAVHQFFPRHYAGTERLTLDISHQLQRMGHSVTVLAYCPDEASGFAENGKCLVKKYEYQGVPVIAIRPRRITQDPDFLIYCDDMEPVLNRIVSDSHLDIIHVLHPAGIGIVAQVARQKGIPVVLTLTDFWLACPKGVAVTRKGDVCLNFENGAKCIRECYDTGWQEKLDRRLKETRDLFRLAGRVITATSSLKQVFEMNSLASNIQLLPYGEDYTGVIPNLKTYLAGDEITLGFLSTLTLHKGAHVLLEAYNLAKRENIALKIYGDHLGQIDYYSRVKNLARGQKKTRFCGAYKFEDLPVIFNAIDMLVVPSTWWENSPLVLSRSLAHNVPAIVSNLGGMTETIKDGENGFGFEVSNPESLARVLQKIADDPTLLNQLKKKIRRPPRIEEHAFEYEKIYLSLIERN